MTLAELRAELSGRGYDVLDDGTRANRYLNQAYKVICRAEDWPFLLTSATAQSPPCTIADLGPIESVFDETTDAQVRPIDRRTVREISTNLTTTGTPTYFYMTGQTTLTTYPVGGSLTVNYWKVPETLEETDEPVIPEDWQLLIVDLASIYAMKDASSWEDIPAAQSQFDRDLAQMRHALIYTQRSEPNFINSNRGHEGY